MRKNLLLGLLITMFSVASFGNPVDLATAKTVAANFWSAVAGGTGSARWTDVTAETGFQEFYILTCNGDEGFVIVAADDRVRPILGYSTGNAFTTPLPPHVNSFLQGYEVEIAYYRENSIMATAEIASLWVSLLEGAYTPQEITVVAPMLTTTWDQTSPYNNLCPDSAGYHAVTGCTATATAQIMKFWNWPPKGVGSHSYMEDNFGYQSADFGTTTYDWAHMPNALNYNSNPTQVNAVATLMYHVGVAVEMDYGINGSGAYVHSYSGWGNMACSENALPEYFRYKNTLHSLFKAYTSDGDWIDAITVEMDAGRPVLESGYGDGGGHAFVIDGYDNNGLFHINWGWSGYYDGYYAHDALNPGGSGTGGNNSHSFNDGRGILVGIEPDGILAVSPSQLQLPKEGGSATLTVSPNSGSSNPWYATTNQSWLTVSPNNGSGAGGAATVTVTATANPGSGSRTATVTVSQGSMQVPVQVTQVADSCLVISLPWSDGFEEGTGCWTTLDVDGDGNDWFLATGAAHDGSYSMASYSYNSNLGGSLHANNYLVSPAISLPAEGDHEFVFHARCGNANYPDTLMVKLTTGAGTSVSQFGATLMGLTPVNTTAYQQYSVNLSAFNGQTVKVAIVHKAYDGLYLAVDDIAILNTASTCTLTALSANSAMGAAGGSGTYNAGSTATLTANAGNGHRFTGWSDGSVVNPREVTVMGDALYVASFADLGGSEHHYDNGQSANHIGAGGTLYWGIRFPAGELSEFTTLSGARIWNYDTGSYVLRIYQGGNDAPGTLVATQTYALSGGDSAWFDAALTMPLTIDQTQPLWLVLYNIGTSYPAVGSHYAGNPDGSWVSLNGNNWASVCDYGFDLTWMVRALLTGTSTTPRYTVSVNTADPDLGVISGGGKFIAGDTATISATAFPGFRFTGWNDGNTANPRSVVVAGDTAFTASLANLGDDERHYDNGTYVSSVGAGGTLYWAVRFPAGTLTGHDLLSEVKIMDKNAGTYDLAIYQGGINAPGSLVCEQQLALTGSDAWHIVPLATPVSLNHGQPLWVVFHNAGVTYPAACSHYAGNPDGSWVSLNGENWVSVREYGLDYTWMVRVGLTDAVPITFYTITAASDNSGQGSVSGGGTYPDGSTVTLTATPASHHHFLQWNDGSTQNPRTITVTGDTTFTATFEIDSYTISVVSEMPTMGSATGGGTFPYGTAIWIEAIPFDGYAFMRWIGGNTDNPRMVTVTGNKTYNALFCEDTGLGDVSENSVNIYSYGSRIVVDGAAGQSVEIYSIDGKLIATELHSDADHRVFTVTADGTYLVRTGNGTVKKVTVVR